MSITMLRVGAVWFPFLPSICICKRQAGYYSGFVWIWWRGSGNAHCKGELLLPVGTLVFFFQRFEFGDSNLLMYAHCFGIMYVSCQCSYLSVFFHICTKCLYLSGVDVFVWFCATDCYYYSVTAIVRTSYHVLWSFIVSVKSVSQQFGHVSSQK